MSPAGDITGQGGGRRRTAGQVAGVGESPQTSNAGTATVRFDSPVTDVVVEYGSYIFPPQANPGQQGISVADLSFCSIEPQASVSVSKNQVLHSESPVDCGVIPGTPDPDAAFHVPGACVAYTITATNSGAGAAGGLALSDTLGPDLIFQTAQSSGFTSDGPGYGLTTPAPGTPCAGGACTISLSQARLAGGATGTIEIRALIQ